MWRIPTKIFNKISEFEAFNIGIWQVILLNVLI